MERKRKGERETAIFTEKWIVSFVFLLGDENKHQVFSLTFFSSFIFFFFLSSPPPLLLLPLFICFLLPLCQNDFFFLLIFVCSSFKVNLKVHLQELARRLASGAGGGGSGSLTNKKKQQQQKSRKKISPFLRARSRPPRQSLWEIRLLPNSFESKTVWSIRESTLGALRRFLHFSGSVKFFDKAILSGSVSHSKSIYRTTFF